MITSVDCPERFELQQAVLGLLNARESEHVESHLTVCVACAETAAQCRATDAFLDALRAQPRVSADLDRNRPLLESLIERLLEMPRISPEPTSRVAAADDDTFSGATACREEEAHFDFLAPPLGPDELGRLGSYRILKLLGAGGMGVVFEAEDAQLKRRVALKTMKPRLAAIASARRRFLREAQSAAAVEHDNIVPIYQVGDDRGIPFIAMPLLRGQSLAGLLAQSAESKQTAKPNASASVEARPLSLGDVLRVGREIAQGLAAAHEHGLIHRDVKPANIWLEAGSGRAKLLDFGLARSSEEGEQITQVGALLGTPSYMSPEQARGDAVDHRTDLFSLGCVLYQMATGRLPFARRDTMATLLAVTQDQPKPPIDFNHDLSDELSRLILQLLAKLPANRPQSAQEVVERLQAEESRLAAGLPSGRSASRPLNRRRTLVVSAAAATICVLGVIVTIGHNRGMFARVETADEMAVKGNTLSGQGETGAEKAHSAGNEVAASATVAHRMDGGASAPSQLTGQPIKAEAFVSKPARISGPRGLVIDWSASGDLTLFGDSLAAAGTSLDANVAAVYSIADGSFYYLREDGTLLLLVPPDTSVKDKGVRYGLIDANGNLVYLRQDGVLLEMAPDPDGATRLDKNIREAFATTRGVVIYESGDGAVRAVNLNDGGSSALESDISLDTARQRLIETSYGTYYLRPDGTLLWVSPAGAVVKDNGVRYGIADINGHLIYLRHDGALFRMASDHNGATKLDLNVRDAFATARGVVVYARVDREVLAINLTYDGATPLEYGISLDAAKQRLKETSSGTSYVRSDGTLLWLAPAAMPE